MLTFFQAKEDKAASLKKDRERDAQIEKGSFVEEEDGKGKGLGRTDIDEEDMQESYFKYVFVV